MNPAAARWKQNAASDRARIFSWIPDAGMKVIHVLRSNEMMKWRL